MGYKKKCVFLAVLLFVSLFGYTQLGLFFFWMGSDSSYFFQSPIWITLFLDFSIGCSLFVLSYTKRKFVLPVLLIIWVLNGRIVAYHSLFDDCPLYVGWFFFRTEKIPLCDYAEDIELIEKETKITGVKYLGITVQNHNINSKFIYTGPFIYNDVDNTFKKLFGRSK